MAVVYDELERVISKWSEVEAASFQRTDTLENIWMRKHPVSPPYNPRGIAKLVSTLHNDHFFGPCPSAQLLEPGYFVSGDGLKTVNDLNDFLYPCGEQR